MPTLQGKNRVGSGRIRSQAGRPIYEVSYSYLVSADSVFQAELQIMAAAGVPLVNQTVDQTGLAICRNKSATRRSDSSLLWDVVCDFSSEIEEGVGGSGGGDTSQAPTEWIPIRETKFERYQEVVTRDYSNASIANSAGQAFETGLTITRHIPIWEFYQFEPATVTDEQIIDRSETVNSATFKGKAAKTLLCVVLSSVVGLYYGNRLRLSQYQLKYNARDWRHKRLDVGTQYKSGTTLLDFTSTDGTVMLGSLDGSGAKQAAGTAPAVRQFDQYPTNTFSFIRI